MAPDVNPGFELPAIAGVSGAGAVYRAGETTPTEIRSLRETDQVLNAGYFFALDSEGRPAWPFRHFYLSGGSVFAQRWRLGEWTYSKELDLFRSLIDDRWIRSSDKAVSQWIERSWRRVCVGSALR